MRGRTRTRSLRSGVEQRVEQLTQLAGGAGDGVNDGDRRAYLEQHGVAGVQRFHSQNGTRIYAMSVETFPSTSTTSTCSSRPAAPSSSTAVRVSTRPAGDLALGFAVVREAFGETARYEDLDWCVVSHAHFDHFGGANVLKRESRARLAVHELDARVLSCFDERLVIASKDCDVFWRRAGVADDERSAPPRDVHGGQERVPPARGRSPAARRRHDRPRVQGASTSPAIARASSACRCTTCF